MIPKVAISHIVGASIGAELIFMFRIQPPQRQNCESVELVRFVDSTPEIPIIEADAFGMTQDGWLQQFPADEPVVAKEEDEPVICRHYWTRPRRT